MSPSDTPHTHPGQAPVAKKVPQERTHHGDTFMDPYEWLRDKENPDVVQYLEAENSYTESVSAPQQSLREDIFEEIKARTVETDLSVPFRKSGYWWFSRTTEGEPYERYCRVPAAYAAAAATGSASDDDAAAAVEAYTPPTIDPDTPLEGEETYLDLNVEAAGLDFFSLGGLSISDAGSLLAFSVDTQGNELYTLKFRDLSTGENLTETIEEVFGAAILNRAGTEAFYLKADSSWRPYQVYRHQIGASAADDELLLEVDDTGLWTDAELSDDKSTLIISSGNSEYGEIRLLDLNTPGATPQLLLSKEHRLNYTVEPVTLDGTQRLLVVHNQNGPNNELSITSLAALRHQDSSEPPDLGTAVIAHDLQGKLDEGMTVTAEHILLSTRVDTVASVGLLSIEALRSIDSGSPAITTSQLPRLGFEAQMHQVQLLRAEYDAPVFRVAYADWLTPVRVYDVAHHDGALLLRKETPLREFHPSQYQVQRLWAPTTETWPDGEPVRIPISVMHHRDTTPSPDTPAVIYGYGSYEMTMDPSLSIPALSLLDRGIIFVVAHVRGGGELGRLWYTEGKKLSKENTFTDFITVTDYLVDEGLVSPDRIAAFGGSAGGLLMGAVANKAPEKYQAIVAAVPFVDPLTSILDPNLPLSSLEWEEWGNPIEDPEVYHYMKAYSPYENVTQAHYPAIAAVTSFHDTRVLYVEPAKWVPVLRENQQGAAPIVLKIEMHGGHGGASGRYNTWRERAWDYAWLAYHLNATEPLPLSAAAQLNPKA